MWIYVDKAGVFIDQGYFSRILECFGFQQTSKLPNGTAKFKNEVDYVAFSEELCKMNNSERFRTYIYDALPYQSNPPNIWEKSHFSEKQKFKTYLDSCPSFITRYGACMKLPNKNCYMGHQGNVPCVHIGQKGVDVRFSIDLVSLATDKRIDKAVLITGDSDFVPAINYAREENMKIILYYLISKPSRIFVNNGLIYACDERIQLTKDILQKCLFLRR